MAVTKLEPWKAHARRLHAAGRSLGRIAATLSEFYGFRISKRQAQRWARGTVAALSLARIENEEEESSEVNGHEAHEVTGAARDHRNDDAERWLSRSDPTYAETRRQWQQPRTDAVARISDCEIEPGSLPDEEGTR